MQSLIPLESLQSGTPTVLAVTAAMSSAGQAIATAVATARVELSNQDPGRNQLQYKVGTGAWVPLDANEGVSLPVSLASSMVMVRKAGTTAGPVQLSVLVHVVEKTQPVGSAASSVEGGGSPVTITGGNQVGNQLTAVPATGWVFSDGQWYLDGVVVSGATGLTITQLQAAIGKAYGFQPTGVPYRATAALTVAGPAGAIAALGNRFAIAGQTTGSANNLRTSKVRAKVNTSRGGTGVRFLFINRSLNNGGAPVGPDSMTIRASVIPIAANSWVTGAAVNAPFPVTFSGASSKVLAPGEWVWSDPVAGWSPAAGAEYDLITSCLGSLQTSIARFMTTGTRGFRQEGIIQASTADSSTHDAYLLGNFGRGMTATTSNTSGTLGNTAALSGGNGLWTAASQIWAVDPDAKVVQNVGFTNAGHTTASITSPASRVWGVNTYLVITDNMTVDNTAVYTAAGAVYTPSGATESIEIDGDSNDRGFGAGDGFGDFNGSYGVSERIINNQYGFFNFAVLGNTASAQSTPANGVTDLFNAIKDAVGFVPTQLWLGSSTNDFATPTNYTADNVRNANNVLAAPLKAKGSKIFVRTCFPRTDAGNTAGVSSRFLAGGARDTHNGYVRGGTAVTGQDGFIEVSSAVENTGNPVLWREDVVVQTDRIHIVPAGIELVRAAGPVHTF